MQLYFVLGACLATLGSSYLVSCASINTIISSTSYNIELYKGMPGSAKTKAAVKSSNQPATGTYQNILLLANAPGTFSNGQLKSESMGTRVYHADIPLVYQERNIDLPFYQTDNGTARMFRILNDPTSNNAA